MSYLKEGINHLPNNLQNLELKLSSNNLKNNFKPLKEAME